MEMPQPQKPERLPVDLNTLQATVALVSSRGLKHFELSKDTRLTLEERKANRFVAINCEDLSRTILSMSLLPPKETEELLKAITLEAVAFHRAQAEKKASSR